MESRSCGQSTSTGRACSSAQSPSCPGSRPSERSVAAADTSAENGAGRSSVQSTSALIGEILRTESPSPGCDRVRLGFRYTRSVLRSASRTRFGRPQVARPRPAPTVAVDAAATMAPEALSFDALDIGFALRRTVADVGFEKATPIQAASIPLGLAGLDVLRK